MYDEHHPVASVGDKVLETYVSQHYSIGDRVFIEPYTYVVVIHCCVLGHCHCDAISLKLNFRFWIFGLLN